MVKRDPNTLDMFSDWEPPQIAAQLPPEVVCGGTLPGKIARAVSRRILASSWLLQILEATDAGVELGLSLLGVKPVITQWWQETPKAKPNTHVIEIFADDVVGGAEALFNDRSVAQIWAMINATKRFSQGTKLVLGERFRTAQPVRSSCRVRMREAARHEFQPVISVPAALPIRSSLRIRVVDHARHVLRGRPGPYRLAEGVIA